MADESKELAFRPLLTDDSIRTFMPEWDKFSVEDKEFLTSHMLRIMDERVVVGMSTLATGKYLCELQDFLEKRKVKVFSKIVRGLNFAGKSAAYKYMDSYKRVAGILPSPTLKTFMALGFKIHSTEERPLGRFTEAYKRLPPPPKQDDPRRQRQYAEELEQQARRIEAREIKRRPVYDEEELLEDNFRKFRADFNKFPDKRHKTKFANRLVGMIVWQLGVSSMTFQTETPPESFLTTRGRPKTVIDEDEAA